MFSVMAIHFKRSSQRFPCWLPGGSIFLSWIPKNPTKIDQLHVRVPNDPYQCFAVTLCIEIYPYCRTLRIIRKKGSNKIKHRPEKSTPAIFTLNARISILKQTRRCFYSQQILDSFCNSSAFLCLRDPS